MIATLINKNISILTTNGLGVMMLTLLLLSSRSIRPGGQGGYFDEKLFFIMVRLNIALCLMESACFMVDGLLFPGAIAIATILNALVFVGNITFSYAWAVYVEFKMFPDMKRIKKVAMIIGIPGAIVMVLNFVNLFTPVFFRITPENIYQRSDLFFIHYLVTYGYLIYGGVRSYRFRNKSEKYLFFPVILFLIPIFIGSMIQFFFFGVALIWPSVAIGVSFLYINVQVESSSVDALSGLYTRRYLDYHLNQECRNVSQESKLAGIMLDIDNFKIINDNYGHQVGDKAIADMGALLRHTLSRKTFIARYAGDEFIILLRVFDENEIVCAIDKISRTIADFNAMSKRPYKLVFSSGYTLFLGNNDSPDEFLKRMDQAMYAEKRKKSSLGEGNDRTIKKIILRRKKRISKVAS